MRNILFILTDQLRFDALGFMGKFPVKTPNIDQLAAEGTVFENAYCSNPVCVPSRASIMTGVNSYDHGVYYNDQNWPEHMETFADKLGQNGYYNTLVGKTHFFPPRKAAGFHKIFVEEDYKEHLKRIGFEKKPGGGKTKELDYLNRAYPIEPTHIPLDDYMPNFLTTRALHELDLISKRRECDEAGNEPFLMKLSYLKPHSPCDQPEPYFSMYSPEELPPPVKTEAEINTFSLQMKDAYDIWSQMDEERVLKHRAQYFGCVTLVDEMIGRAIQKLKDMGIYDNTLIVLTADHGDHLCDHHLQQKGHFWESSVKVPFIFAGPGVGKGHRVRDNVSLIDLFPTLMDYCDLAMPRLRDESGKLIYADTHERDSVSLMPYLDGGDALNPDRIIIAENAMRGQRFMLKKGDVKVNYYVNPNAENEFDYFDLSRDPDELDNKGKSFTVDNLEPDMKAAFDMVLEKSARHADGHYFFQNKVRPIFT